MSFTSNECTFPRKALGQQMNTELVGFLSLKPLSCLADYEGNQLLLKGYSKTR